MGIWKLLYDKNVNCYSPLVDDYEPVVKCDKNGNEMIAYQLVDYSKVLQSNGTVDMWSLKSLLASGINPNFSVHTGYNTRLDGVNDINEVVSMIDQIDLNKDIE